MPVFKSRIKLSNNRKVKQVLTQLLQATHHLRRLRRISLSNL
jgi:hypothetical protein